MNQSVRNVRSQSILTPRQEPDEVTFKLPADVEGVERDVGLAPPGQPREERLAVVGDRQPAAKVGIYEFFNCSTQIM